MANDKQFSEASKRILSLAEKEAKKLHSNTIDSDHLLLAFIIDRNNLAFHALAQLGVSEEKVRRELTEKAHKEQEEDEQACQPGPEFNDILIAATRNATVDDQDTVIKPEHLLLGLVNTTNKARLLLTSIGVTPRMVKGRLDRLLQARKSQKQTREDDDSDDHDDNGILEEVMRSMKTPQHKRGKDESSTPLVDQLASDLTRLAEEGKLDPVIGRDKEVERVIQILARRTKNNPALIGEPGVGKTAVVEGLAQRIVEGDVPALLLDKRVLQLDVGSLVAGTMYRGQFEERLQRVIEELKTCGAIVFFDELHMLVGAGSSGTQVDAANILKPALSRGELQVIGATTLNEYRKYIERDPALERRFQKVLVEEPTIDETIAILQGLRANYERHHRLKISDEALHAAAKLSARYISDRFLPDKAIDLMDEAASHVRMRQFDKTGDSKVLIAKLRKVRQEFKDAAENENSQALPALEKQREELEEELRALQNGGDYDESVSVSAEDVAETVSAWTGIPLTQLAEEETERLLQLEDNLQKSIIGQMEAIEVISKAIRRARAGLQDPKRPLGSFMFLGPTGVGKTELSKALAREMFGSEDSLIQIDMSEFMERHSVSRLVGAPPGYIGFEEAGQLTESIRRKPFSIVVFDEVEKAHPDVLNILLQIMEEGHLTDAKGQRVSFKNAILIMTTNIGVDLLKLQNGLGFDLQKDESKEERRHYEEMSKDLMKSLNKSFRPEFINRLDSVIVFRSLNREDIRTIVSLEINKLQERLADRELSIELSDEALLYLADEGYKQEMGARPVRRVIQQKLEEKLSDALLTGQFVAGDKIFVDLAMPVDSESSTKRLTLSKAVDSASEENSEPVPA